MKNKQQKLKVCSVFWSSLTQTENKPNRLTAIYKNTEKGKNTAELSKRWFHVIIKHSASDFKC